MNFRKLDGPTSGSHGAFRVTPITLATTERVEVPSADGISGQLRRRITCMLQNTSSGTVYIGGPNVGYGTGHGASPESSCSGIRVEADSIFAIDAGRNRMYVFNPNGESVTVRLLEVA